MTINTSRKCEFCPRPAMRSLPGLGMCSACALTAIEENDRPMRPDEFSSIDTEHPRSTSREKSGSRAH